MKNLKDELAKNLTIPAANTPTSSNPNQGAAMSETPLQIVCFDPADHTQPCPICGGMGLIRYNVPVDHPRFGKLFRCPNYPAEVDVSRQQKLRDLSNLSAYSAKSFQNFEIARSGYSDEEIVSLRVAHEGALRYAQQLGGWLLLEGSYGTGKTHLAAAVGNLRLTRGDPVLFITAPDLLDHLRSAYSPTAEASYDEQFERIKNIAVLILDDLGVENPSAWAQEKLFQLLNHRYSYQKPTIITTNMDIDKLDPRIRSRLLDENLIRRIKINAPDYRSTMHNKNDQLLSRLHLYQHMTFDSFETRHNVSAEEADNLTKAVKKAREYAAQPQHWLMWMGGYGVGKTHLAAAIALYRQSVGDMVLFMTVPDLLDYLRTTFNPNSSVTFDKLFSAVREVPLLVLDDLHTENGSSWAKEKLFQLLDFRYVARLPTIITTAQALDLIEPRIQTRLADKRLCDIFAITARSFVDRKNNRPYKR
jgi:DNA replication protein DnaC